jgi:transcriptional regulator GlxA family with amidase domain
MRLYFLVLPHVHVMDLSGPVQVFYEANGFGGDYRIAYCASTPKVRSAQGLWLSDLEPLPDIRESDFVLVPGLDSATLDQTEDLPVDWLRASAAAGARIGSICSGAFALARAGLLDGRVCTTHWKVTDRLQREHPKARVMANRLFVRDGKLITSAGVASGVDMALAVVEEDHGPLVAAGVAREMVVYLRRGGESDQRSVYLDYRTHLHPGIHRVQDWLVSRVNEKPTITELARVAGMSPRNLTRLFRQATGISLKQFASELKLEVAGNLLRNPNETLESIASECGFKDARQLRRLWRKSYGVNPSAWRGRAEASAGT